MQRTVKDIYERLQEVCNVDGRNPNTVCGAAIFLGVKALKLDIQLEDVANIVEMKQQTIASYLKILKKDEK